MPKFVPIRSRKAPARRPAPQPFPPAPQPPLPPVARRRGHR